MQASLVHDDVADADADTMSLAPSRGSAAAPLHPSVTIVNIDATDRRRFVTAAIVTLLALPALWWANRDEGSAGPKVATAGVEVPSPASAANVVVTELPAPPTTVGRSNLPPSEPATGEEPIFMDGPEVNPGGVNEIAVPARPAVQTDIVFASYRGDLVSVDSCLVRDITSGTLLTVVNLDNNRSVTCRARLAPRGQVDDIVLHRDRFVELADVTDAPVLVEIRR